MSIPKRNIHILGIFTFSFIYIYLSLRPFYYHFKFINRAAICVVQTNFWISSTTYSCTVATAASLWSFDIHEFCLPFLILIYSLATVFLIVYDWWLNHWKSRWIIKGRLRTPNLPPISFRTSLSLRNFTIFVTEMLSSKPRHLNDRSVRTIATGGGIC